MQFSTVRRMPMLAKFLSLLAGLLLCSAALAADPPYVSIKTTMGEIVLELDPVKAPKTVANFLQYVKNGHYKDTIFHRVINGFMIQGGGMTKDMKQKPTGKGIPNESNNGLENLPYTIAMARHDDPNSATAQWFINVADNYGLNFTMKGGPGYAVFGHVVLGKEVVDKIKGVVTDDKFGMRDVPVVPIFIKSVTVIKKPEAVIAAEATEKAKAEAEEAAAKAAAEKAAAEGMAQKPAEPAAPAAEPAKPVEPAKPAEPADKPATPKQ